MKPHGFNLRKKSANEPFPYGLLLQADETKEAINKYIQLCEVHLIQEVEKIIGVCAIQTIDTSTIEIKNLAIAKEYRNRRIGSWCIQQIKELYPYKVLLVGTGDASVHALRFYKKNGFKQYAVRKGFFIDNYDHPIIENGIQLIDQIVLKYELAKG